MDPVIAGKEPIEVEVEEGKTYFWCTCGRSARQPFCDGAHKGSDMAPKSFKAETSGTVWLCACKRTREQPFCDGSHEAL
ncbi:CDGSH iron-sulfur domain-containing protein [Magnetospirillum sp. UT-4]|uniref:CDGSH iron-sulfur domain-containing protein n=1 Tax=Magnetospirillum sp. UT-4 TaxID=2681467 RepID=UPI00137CD978|nr:CDGSH iron-sulfur domain-containing protein [Magnetospirillum sp. UT-4]CAA7626944.1 CDGSH iron sulfur domain-containing protein 3 [Magnetospirillum sp. UT-4]